MERRSTDRVESAYTHVGHAKPGNHSVVIFAQTWVHVLFMIQLLVASAVAI